MKRTPLPINLATSDMETSHLEALIAKTREGGHRLAVIDWDIGLAHRYADPERDLHIDTDRSNWNIFADISRSSEMRSLAFHLALHGVSPRLFSPFYESFASILETASADPEAHLSTIADIVRRYEPHQVASIVAHSNPAIDALNDDDLHAVLAAMRTVTQHFHKRDHDIPPISIKRWRRSNPRSILFITAHTRLSNACPTVMAMIDRAIP